jgi:dihydrofolate reductase
MAKGILGMRISLDGFINDRNGSVGALYPDLEILSNTEPMRKSIQNTGAVVMGWNTFAMAEDPDSYAGNYEYQVPIFALPHEAPIKQPKETGKLTFTFVTEGIESAIKQSKAAAGAREISVIGGASTAQQCIKAGLADELHINILPVLLSGGLRPFEDIAAEQIRLERLAVIELPGDRTYLRFRVVR